MRKSTLILILLFAIPLAADEYVVNSAADNGFGTLRWAIEQSNASLGVVDTITFGLTATIHLETRLPYVLDPAIIGGTNAHRLTIDAKNIADGVGGGDALWIKANDVRVRNLIANNALRYGLYLSGLRIDVADSEAHGNRSAGFYLYGNGSVLTNSIARNNTRGIMVDSTLVELDGNIAENNTNVGIHVAGTARDNMIGFHMEPCPILCIERSGNTVSGSPIGIFVEGTFNTIAGNVVTNNGSGIVVFGDNNRFEHNDTSRNAGNGLTAFARARIAAHTGVCNEGLLIDGMDDSPRIELTSAVADRSWITIDGVLRGQPNETYDVRFVTFEGDCFFGAESFPLTASWIGDDYVRLRTDANGEARFHRVRWEGEGAGSSIAAYSLRAPVADRDNPAGPGVPSDISAAIAITRNPSPHADLQLVTQADKERATPGETITFANTVTNNGPAASSVIIELQRPEGTEFVSYDIIGSEHPTTCWLTGLNFCSLTLAAGETQTVEHTVRVTSARGAIAYRATLKPESATPDPVLTNNATVTTVLLNGEPSRARAVRK